MSVAPPGYVPPEHPVAPGERPELPDGMVPREPPPRWKPWTAWAALLLGFGGAIAGGIVLGVVFAATGSGSLDHPGAAFNIVATVVQDGSLVLAAIVFARKSGGVHPRDFGLRLTRVASGIGLAVVCLIAFFVFTVVWTTLVGSPEDSSSLLDDLGVKESTTALIFGAALVCVVAPIAEEFFFRGYFFSALRGWRGLWPAAILTGLVFGGIHLGSAPVSALLPLAFFGFGLCVLYDRTGSLYPGIAAHTVNNSLAFGIAEHWDWQILVTAVASGAVITAIFAGVHRLASP